MSNKKTGKVSSICSVCVLREFLCESLFTKQTIPERLRGVMIIIWVKRKSVASNLLRGTNQGIWGTEVSSGVQGQNMETLVNTSFGQSGTGVIPAGVIFVTAAPLALANQLLLLMIVKCGWSGKYPCKWRYARVPGYNFKFNFKAESYVRTQAGARRRGSTYPWKCCKVFCTLPVTVNTCVLTKIRSSRSSAFFRGKKCPNGKNCAGAHGVVHSGAFLAQKKTGSC